MHPLVYYLLQNKKILEMFKKRFEELKDLLSDQPDWSGGLPYHQEIKELRKEIRDEKE